MRSTALRTAADGQAPLDKHLLDIAEAQSDPGIEPDRVADDVGRDAVTLERELTR